MPTFTDHALADTMQTRQLQPIEPSVLVLLTLLQIAQPLFKRHKLALEHIRLIHLVGHDDQPLLCRQLKDGAYVVGSQRGAGRIARVDDDDGAHVGAVVPRVFQRGSDPLNVRAPRPVLFEVVGHGLRAEQGQGGRVERVLRDGHEDARLRAGADDVQERVDAAGRAVGQVDLVLVAGVAVSSLDKVGHGLADAGRAVRLRVRADALDVFEQLLRALDHVLFIPQRPGQDVFVLKQLRVFEDGGDLAEECDGLLVELLRVADVGGDDRVEG